MIPSCGHGDEWFVVQIPEDGTHKVCCFDCVREYIQELPPGWTANVTKEEIP